MTPRDRYARCRAYARASKRCHDALRAMIHGNERRGLNPALNLARERERHAYDRLPLHVQAQLIRP